MPEKRENKIPEDKYKQKRESDPLKKLTYQNMYGDAKSWILWYLKELKNSERGKNNLILASVASGIGRKAGDINRDVDDLKKQKWIKKDDREYEISFVGETIFTNIDEYFLDFFPKHTKYFLNHDFGTLPRHFQLGIGVFKNCELLGSESGSILIERKELEIIQNSEKYISSIIGDGRYTKELLESIKEKAKNKKGFHIRTVFPTDALKPPVWVNKFIKKLDEILDKNQGRRETRKTSIVNVGIVMNEKESLVMFPLSGKNRPDTSFAFYGKDQEFLEWCRDYFNHCWEEGMQ